MILAAALAVAVALVNVGAAAWLGRRERGGPSFGWLQGLGFGFRLATLFGTAHGLWVFHRRVEEVALFIFLGAVLQTVALAWISAKHG